MGLAYFGQINPQIFDKRPGEGFAWWFLPPPRPGTMPRICTRSRSSTALGRPGCEPGLYAISASLLRGLRWRVYSNDTLRKESAPYEAESHAFDYFLALKPIAHVGYSIFLYRVSEADAARLAPIWDEEPPASSPRRAPVR